MPVLVGDLIISTRTIIPDMPGTLPIPAAPSAAAPAAGGSFQPGNYTARVSALNAWGETAAGLPLPVVLVGPPNLAISVTINPLGAGVTAYRVYISDGTTVWYVETDPATLTITATDPNAIPVGVMPLRNRAWLPDTDGTMFPAATFYAWLRDALTQAAAITGGIYDATGVRTTSGIPMYQLLGDWRKLTHAWFDGWILGMGNKADIFYRNKITAVSGVCVTDVRGKKAIIEYFPVPNRTGGSTTCDGGATASATTIPVVDASTFVLPYGLAQSGSEIFAYQQNNTTTLEGCLRGLGGTTPAAIAHGAQVVELNGRLAGYRYPSIPRIGSAALDLDIPPGWDVQLQLFIESRYLESQRRYKEANDLRRSFEQEMKTLNSAAQPFAGPRQIGENYMNEVYGAGAQFGGGWLLP